MAFTTVVLEATLRLEVDHETEEDAVSDAMDQVAELSRSDIDWVALEVS